MNQNACPVCGWRLRPVKRMWRGFGCATGLGIFDGSAQACTSVSPGSSGEKDGFGLWKHRTLRTASAGRQAPTLWRGLLRRTYGMLVTLVARQTGVAADEPD